MPGLTGVLFLLDYNKLIKLIIISNRKIILLIKPLSRYLVKYGRFWMLMYL